MNILVFGAGVLGSLYGARLQQAGHNVTMLARGERYQQISEHGLVIDDAATGTRTVTQVGLVTELAPDAVFDLALVIVRRSQLASVLPALAANSGIKNILFMVNNAAGPEEIIAAVGRERVMLGFPGAGGTREGHVVRAVEVPSLIQKTTIGELDGTTTPRLQQVVEALRAAGFVVATSANMDAWLKSHATLVSPIANGFYYAGDNYRLAKSRQGLRLMARSFREGASVLGKLGIPLTPGKMRLMASLPEGLLAFVAGRIFATRFAELAMCRHAMAARDEMLVLADELRELARQSGVPTPASDELYRYIARQ